MGDFIAGCIFGGIVIYAWFLRKSINEAHSRINWLEHDVKRLQAGEGDGI